MNLPVPRIAAKLPGVRAKEGRLVVQSISAFIARVLGRTGVYKRMFPVSDEPVQLRRKPGAGGLKHFSFPAAEEHLKSLSFFQEFKWGEHGCDATKACKATTRLLHPLKMIICDYLWVQ